MRTGGWRRVNTGARRFVSGGAKLQVVSRSDLGRPWHGFRRPTCGVNVSASAARLYPRGRAPSFAMQARAALSTGATVDPVVSPGWLAENLGSVKVLDATWYLPSKKKEGRETHRVGPRIPGAKYFCIDAIASQDAASLKHMLPPPDAFAAAADALGLKNSDTVVVYEANGMAFAAARAWWMFRCFGHENVKVLNGGLPAWIREREAGGGPASAFGLDESEAPEESVDAGGNASVSAQAAGGGGSSAAYRAELNPGLVVSKADILSDLDLGKGKKMHLLDARGAARYKGTEPEARPGLRSGHIPGSFSMPFASLICDDGGLMPAEALMKNDLVLRALEEERAGKFITASCGSGVTACVVALAFARLGKDVAVYDGSWTDWGADTSCPIETG
mmetsp:Transcript_3532/g.12402  ORF Transcript_3532/g.12402 Transcript_3532/m.12402 type:complete len:391 (-) Transcript_3532:147-1319(-)